MIAIGVGANSKARDEDFASALASIRAETGGDVVATFEDAPFRAPLQTAASRQSLAHRTLPLADLRKRNDDCMTRSERSLALYGVASIAEASALAAAGPRSELIAARRIIGNVTVAAAKSADTKESPT
ncbi:putative precorrin methylase [Hyphomicrobium denitrificans ATCC 51888]|uniref:Putative precorrin methylase n=1 Tax=Hyphomicrobium denitrificans (strain ATCC 51888 / DSM 1869 / NCIMB 11706 / TK 0415) TaxID=582899 RepID=D8JTU0_HYPDA|nr:cobalamin biosynthesis protein [Hyphomicrobium denitrificans]ADJ24488.1 putative precorrin methylase [Hyphomicrobium denitrificans ATCC 51888]